MTPRARSIAIAIAGAMTLVALASCREPTQVLIEARTNLAYRAGLVTSFTVGTTGETENISPTTEARDPWGPDGFIGSLTVVPGSADDAALSVKVVLGVARDARTCTPPSYDGCIVARRRLRYSPHERLRLPITLYAKCVGVACTADATCNRLGQCVDAQVDPTTCDSDEGCIARGDPQVRDPEGMMDASVASDAADSSTTPDAPPDAVTDGPTDAASDGFPGGGGVACAGTKCKVGEICCSVSPTQGACLSSASSCPYYRIECDGREQCPSGQLCCQNAGVPNPGTACNMTSCATMGEVCHSTTTNPICYIGGQTCTGTAFGYYRICK